MGDYIGPPRVNPGSNNVMLHSNYAIGVLKGDKCCMCLVVVVCACKVT